MSVLWNLGHLRPIHDSGVRGETIPELFVEAVAARGDDTFLRTKELGIWRSWSWDQTGRAVRQVAMGLVSLGFTRGERASILSNTVVEWILADLGVLCAGGVSSGIYPTDSPAQVHYLCEDSASVVVFVEDDEQLDKLLEVRDKLPRLRHIVVFDMDGLKHFDDPMVIGFTRLREIGDRYDATHPGEFETCVAAARPDDLAILIYTSGTTGRPKGAMHSHRGVVHTVRGLNLLISQTEHDERMCFLPLCHVAERVGGEYFAISTGTKLNFVENPATVAENVREIAPTVFLAVPRVWEKFYSTVSIAIAEATRVQQLAYRWSIAVGERVAERVLEGHRVSPGLKAAFHVARLLALNNVRKTIGIHRARYLVTGAAPISPDLVRWYLALGVPMLEVWGQTETCGASTGMPAERIRPGTIGPSVPYNEVRIDPASGELLVRGQNVFMGYLNQPEKTAETLDADGWLHTGDVGKLDEDGYFRITDRMKDIIITAGGKNVTPSEIENELKFSPYITDAVVVGDKRPYLTALVMIDQENVEKYAQDHDVPFSSYASLTRSSQVQALIEAEVERVNRKLARAEQIKTFCLLETQLGAEDEELTPTMKLKRKFVEQKYAQLIESMYKGENT